MMRSETNGRKGDYRIAGRPALENVWKRGMSDAWTFLRTPYPWVADALLTGATAILAAIFIDDTVTRTVVPFIAFIIGLLFAFVGATCRAPLMQRSEARNEIIQIRSQQEPKLTISNAIVQQMSSYYSDNYRQSIMPSALRIQIENNSDVAAENCTAKLLDMKPIVEWRDLIESDRIVSYGGNEFVGFDVPFPIPLRWSADESQKIDINARGEALLDVCFYEDRSDRITLVFTSESTESSYGLPVADVVLSVRVDSKDCMPIYCVCKYRPDPPILEMDDQCVVLYASREAPELNDYREFKMIPRPPEWDEQRANVD